MTVCPIAIVSGCRKCPAFSFCPLKSVIGDYKQEEEAQSDPQSDGQNGEVKSRDS
jgi:hypothetical protein